MLHPSSLLRSAGRFTLALLTLVVAAAGAAQGDLAYTRADADALHRKIQEIVVAGGPNARARLTPVSEREVNAYLRFHLHDQVPAGITDPVITIIGGGRLSGRAIVDLDAVSKANRSASSSWFDPMRLLTGRLPVTVDGVLTTRQGVGRFDLATATIAGLPVPKTVLQQVVSHYSRSDDNPRGISLDDAFELPASIREIRVEPGKAVVVQ